MWALKMCWAPIISSMEEEKPLTASSICYHFHLFVEWHVFFSFHDPERQDSETTEMFAQSWSIYLKVAFPWRASATARFKVRSRKQTNTIFTTLQTGMLQRTFQVPLPDHPPHALPLSWHLDKQCGALRRWAGIRVYNPFKFTGQTGKEGKCQKLQIKQLILKGNEACKWIIFRLMGSDFLNICHSWVVAWWSVC